MTTKRESILATGNKTRCTSCGKDIINGEYQCGCYSFPDISRYHPESVHKLEKQISEALEREKKLVKFLKKIIDLSYDNQLQCKCAEYINEAINKK